MNISEELTLFQRYPQVFKCDKSEQNESVITLTAIHMTRQLTKFINPGLDSSLIIQAVMDLQGGNMFSNPRSTMNDLPIASILESYPEGYHAKFMIELSMMYYVTLDIIDITYEKLEEFKLAESTLSYYGKGLFELHEFLRTEAIEHIQNRGGSN